MAVTTPGATVLHPIYGIGTLVEVTPSLLPGRDPATCKAMFDADAKYGVTRRVYVADLKPAMRVGAPQPRPVPQVVA